MNRVCFVFHVTQTYRHDRHEAKKGCERSFFACRLNLEDDNFTNIMYMLMGGLCGKVAVIS